MLVKQRIKYIQTLGQKKFREKEGFFIAEGPKLVHELLEADVTAVKEVYALKEWIDNSLVLPANISIVEISEQELEKISQLTTPNLVVAIVQQFDTSNTLKAKDQITLALDKVQDPGNLGTIIRIADWFGIKQIVCSLDSADMYNPKVVQSTMGSIARVKIIYTDLKEWLAVQKNIPIYAASLQGENIASIKKINEGIIIIGNESKGISKELLKRAMIRITIPAKGKAESLNAAVATGIILSHILA